MVDMQIWDGNETKIKTKHKRWYKRVFQLTAMLLDIQREMKKGFNDYVWNRESMYIYKGVDDSCALSLLLRCKVWMSPFRVSRSTATSSKPYMDLTASLSTSYTRLNLLVAEYLLLWRLFWLAVERQNMVTKLHYSVF